MPHPVDVHVGNKIRQARNTKGLNQSELGDILGVSFQQMQKYEKGTNRTSSSKLWLIAQALQVPVTYFFDGIPTEGEDAFGIDANDNLSRRSIQIAGEIDSIPNDAIRQQILSLIKVCAKKA